MKEKKKSRLPVVLTVLFCVLYLILAVHPLTTELHLSPEWTQDVQRTPQPMLDGDEPIPFKLGQSAGYFTKDGRIVRSITFPFKAAISSSYYAPYGAGNVSTTLFTADGSTACTMDAPGFPFFDGDRIFNFLPGGSAVAQYRADGARIWQYEGYAPITAFSSSEGGSVAGFADGSVVSFASDGTMDQNFAPGGSATQVILGAAISSDGKTVACVSGLGRQRFVVARKDGDLSKIIWHTYLKDESREQQLVRFSSDGSTVFYGCRNGLGIVDLKSLKGKTVGIPGTVVQIEESDDEPLAFVLSRSGGTYTVTILEASEHKAGSFSFDARSAFIQVRGDALFVGKDNKISRITVSRS